MARLKAQTTPPVFRGSGWAALLQEFEHQATHWDTPDHGETGHLIAEALRAAVYIARNGGLQCEHRRVAEHIVAKGSNGAVKTATARRARAL
jgi:hypothetical protein